MNPSDLLRITGRVTNSTNLRRPVSGLQNLRRALARRVLARLHREIHGLSAHLGEDYERGFDLEARTHRRLGRKFAWLAFGFAPWRMWDLHVGVVEVDDKRLSLGFHISERAAAVLIPYLEEFAAEIKAPIVHQRLAVEYQANLPPVAASDSNADALVDTIISLCRSVAPIAMSVTCPRRMQGR